MTRAAVTAPQLRSGWIEIVDEGALGSGVVLIFTTCACRHLVWAGRSLDAARVEAAELGRALGWPVLDPGRPN